MIQHMFVVPASAGKKDRLKAELRAMHAYLRPVLSLPVCVCLLAASGCGESGPPRASITGRVTVGNVPLKAGRVLFVPESPAVGPAASAAVVDGEYKLSELEGPVVGINRVEVEAERSLGFAIDDEA